MVDDFDLESLRSADQSLKRTPLYAILGVVVWLGVVLALILGYRLSTVESSGLSTSVGQGVVFGGAVLAIGIAMSLVVLPRFFAGASRLVIDDTGVLLYFGPRKRIDYLWTERASTFLLFDFSKDSEKIEPGTDYMLYGTHFWNRRSVITKEAFNAVLAAARQRGVVESESTGNPSWYGMTPTIYRIRGSRGANGTSQSKSGDPVSQTSQ